MRILEYESIYNGYKYLVRRFINERNILVRCGYVKLKSDDIKALGIKHNVSMKGNIKEVDRKIHMFGGCTFVDTLPWESGLWIAFIVKYPFNNPFKAPKRESELEHVKDEIKKVIDQLIVLKKAR